MPKRLIPQQRLKLFFYMNLQIQCFFIPQFSTEQFNKLDSKICIEFIVETHYRFANGGLPPILSKPKFRFWRAKVTTPRYGKALL
jgi:hypothetical protein